MIINNVWIDPDCTACGLCEDICPEVFKVEDIAVVKKGVKYAEYEKKIKEAAESCPMDVIKYSE